MARAQNPAVLDWSLSHSISSVSEIMLGLLWKDHQNLPLLTIYAAISLVSAILVAPLDDCHSITGLPRPTLAPTVDSQPSSQGNPFKMSVRSCHPSAQNPLFLLSTRVLTVVYKALHDQASVTSLTSFELCPGSGCPGALASWYTSRFTDLGMPGMLPPWSICTGSSLHQECATSGYRPWPTLHRLEVFAPKFPSQEGGPCQI